MKLQDASKKETLHIAIGVLICSAVMQIVFLLFGAWSWRVMYSNLLGDGWAVLNFVLLAISVQMMAATEDVKRGRLKLQMSYSLRMLGTFVVLIIGFRVSCFAWLPTLLPLLFPRITILGMQMLGMYHPEPKQKGSDLE